MFLLATERPDGPHRGKRAPSADAAIVVRLATGNFDANCGFGQMPELFAFRGAVGLSGETMKARDTIAAATVALALSGCVTVRMPSDYVDRKSMTIAQAICEVQNAIVLTRRQDAASRAGLAIGEATVQFNLKAAESSGASGGAKMPVGVVEWSMGSTSSLGREAGNTLTIKFVNPTGSTGPVLHQIQTTPFALKEPAMVTEAELEKVLAPGYCEKTFGFETLSGGN